jgi:hypothetical protein
MISVPNESYRDRYLKLKYMGLKELEFMRIKGVVESIPFEHLLDAKPMPEGVE